MKRIKCRWSCQVVGLDQVIDRSNNLHLKLLIPRWIDCQPFLKSKIIFLANWEYLSVLNEHYSYPGGFQYFS